MDDERGPARRELGERLMGRHAGGAAGKPGQHHALRHLRHRELAPEHGGGGGEGGDAGGERVGDAVAFEPADLLGHCAVDREIAGVEAGDVLAAPMGGDELGLDLIEREGSGVDQPRPLRAETEDLRRDQRARIEADRATPEELAPAQGEEISRARPRSDEMHRHLKCPII